MAGAKKELLYHTLLFSSLLHSQRSPFIPSPNSAASPSITCELSMEPAHFFLPGSARSGYRREVLEKSRVPVRRGGAELAVSAGAGRRARLGPTCPLSKPAGRAHWI